MARASDEILAHDLREAGLTPLAERAETGEWNDFFGPHEAPQHHLIGVLRDEIRIAHVVRKRLIANVIAGKYDATAAESAEWDQSPEGQELLAHIIRNGGHLEDR